MSDDTNVNNETNVNQAGHQPKPQAFIYACVASPHDASGETLPLAEQVATCQNLVQRLSEKTDIEVKAIYQDGLEQPVVGSKRPQLDAALKALEAGEAQFLMIASFTAFPTSRKATFPAGHRIKKLKDKGVQLIVCDQQDTYDWLENPKFFVTHVSAPVLTPDIENTASAPDNPTASTPNATDDATAAELWRRQQAEELIASFQLQARQEVEPMPGEGR